MSKIEWTEKTYNPIVGCSHASPGCANCYAQIFAARLEKMLPQEHRGFEVLPNQYAALTKPSKAGPVWTGRVNRAARKTLLAPMLRKKQTKYFVCSMGDLFHESVPDEWIDQVFAVMVHADQHVFQVLTKRTERMREYLNAPDRLSSIREQALVDFGGRVNGRHAHDIPTNQAWPLPNVWVGTSVEDQRRSDERIPHLLETRAAVRFVSCEPLLGPVDLTRIELGGHRCYNALTGVHFWEDGTFSDEGETRLSWVIVGSESGPGARPMDFEWAKALKDQCVAAGVPFFLKQRMDDKGKKVSMPFLDGQVWDQMPERAPA